MKIIKEIKLTCRGLIGGGGGGREVIDMVDCCGWWTEVIGADADVVANDEPCCPEPPSEGFVSWGWCEGCCCQGSPVRGKVPDCCDCCCCCPGWDVGICCCNWRGCVNGGCCWICCCIDDCCVVRGCVDCVDCIDCCCCCCWRCWCKICEAEDTCGCWLELTLLLVTVVAVVQVVVVLLLELLMLMLMLLLLLLLLACEGVARGSVEPSEEIFRTVCEMSYWLFGTRGFHGRSAFHGRCRCFTLAKIQSTRTNVDMLLIIVITSCWKKPLR